MGGSTVSFRPGVYLTEGTKKPPHYQLAGSKEGPRPDWRMTVLDLQWEKQKRGASILRSPTTMNKILNIEFHYTATYIFFPSVSVASSRSSCTEKIWIVK